MDKIGGTKFVFALLLEILGIILVIANKVTGEAFLNFSMVVGGTYVIGNVGATLANNVGGNKNG